MVQLGVNIDHVATVREARRTVEPDPVAAARECERAGCDSIVCHLREDRRHINDADLRALKRSVKTRLNLEMSIAKEIVAIACRVKPDQATLVPERREEVTTEGGLDVARHQARVAGAVQRLAASGIEVSLFIAPQRLQIDASVAAGARIVEFHTGEYANAGTAHARKRCLDGLKRAAKHAAANGLVVNAGHGLTYLNVRPVALIEEMNELNIGHSVISRAIFIGIGPAVREMMACMRAR